MAIDKQAHFWAGMAICLAVSLFAGPFIGLLIATAAGVIKEILDYFGKGTPDVLDAVATFLGALVGFGLIFVTW